MTSIIACLLWESNGLVSHNGCKQVEYAFEQTTDTTVTQRLPNFTITTRFSFLFNKLLLTE